MIASRMEVIIFDVGGKRLFKMAGHPSDVYPACKRYCEDSLGLDMPVRSYIEAFEVGMDRLMKPMSDRRTAGRYDGRKKS